MAHSRVPRYLSYMERHRLFLFGASEKVSHRHPPRRHIMTEAKKTNEWTKLSRNKMVAGACGLVVVSAALMWDRGKRKEHDQYYKLPVELEEELRVLSDKTDLLEDELHAMNVECDSLSKEEDANWEDANEDDKEVFRDRLKALKNRLESLNERKDACMKEWDEFKKKIEPYRVD